MGWREFIYRVWFTLLVALWGSFHESVASQLTLDRDEGESAPMESSISMVGDLFSNVTGGLQQGRAFFGLANAELTLDGEVFGWDGARIHLSSWASTGGSISTLVGDCQGLSNIESPRDLRLFEAWVEQRLGERLSVKAGLYDLNSEFDVIESAQLFLNSSHGIGPEFSQVGAAGPSIFPYTSFGLRLERHFSGNRSVKVALVDPDPPGLESDLPWLVVGEVSSKGLKALSGTQFDLTIGGWFFTSKTQPILVNKDKLNFGLYAATDWSMGEIFGRDAQAFVRLGTASHYSNQLSGYFGSGISFQTDWLRKGDSLGFGLAHASDGQCYRQVMAEHGVRPESFELSAELTYRVRLFSWLHIQPDLQYIVNPGGTGQLDDALVFGTRFEINLTASKHLVD